MHPAVETLQKVRSLTKAGMQSARNPTDYLNVALDAYKKTDDYIQNVLTTSEAKPACCEGCFYCCHIKVDVSASEAFAIVTHLHKTYPESTINEIQQRAKINKERIADMSLDQQMGTNIACPLLSDNKCMVYSSRPMACRSHHSLDVEPCKLVFENPSDSTTKGPQIPRITYPLAAIRMGIKAGESDAGFDSRVYDINGSLVEALANPKCEKRWRDKKTAFSKEALAKDSESSSMMMEQMMDHFNTLSASQANRCLGELINNQTAKQQNEGKQNYGS